MKKLIFYLKKQSRTKTLLSQAWMLGLLFLGLQANAQVDLGQITTANASCNFTTTVCNNDTIEFEPNNTTDFTNFKWYFGSVSPANLISGPDAAKNVISVSGAKIQVVTPYGTYILTGEYTSPTGLNCPTLNDTITIDFHPEPLLTTAADTICVDAGESSDLASLVTDGNSTGGALTFYESYANAFDETGAVSSPVSPSATQKYYVRSETVNGCYDIDSIDVVVRCMSIGNLVWYDTDNSGTIGSGESGIDGVTVNLYIDLDNNGTLSGSELTTIYATQATSGGGRYLFEGLREGNYLVSIPSTDFGSGGVLEHLYSSGTSRGASGADSETAAPDPDTTPSDLDDNGLLSGGNIVSSTLTLTYNLEPINETPDNSNNPNDTDDNLTVDFGFYGMSVGSFAFLDTNNDGVYMAADDAVSAGTTINLRSSDGTLISSTVTDANGKYLFVNLPEGDYIVGAEVPTGNETSDDIATSATPLSTDNDDNGVTLVSGEIRSSVFTLDADNMNTGEADHSDSYTGLSTPAISNNSLTPDGNSEFHIDFGFKPICTTIDNASADQALCANDTGTDLTVETSSDGSLYDIRWVRFTSPQTGSDMYTGGVDLATNAPTGSSNPYTATHAFDPADFPNSSHTMDSVYYVYAVLSPAPTDVTCRPFEVIKITIYPEPTASNATLTQCETVTGGGTSIFTLSGADAQVLNSQTGMTVTYHDTPADATNNALPITTKTTGTNTTVYARVETSNGCFETSEVLLNVNPNPDFSLSLPDVCQDDNPIIKITLENGADADPNVSLNSGTAFAFSTLSPVGIVTTNEGLLVDAGNTIILTNTTTCTHTESITTPAVTPKVCIPVSIRRTND